MNRAQRREMMRSQTGRSADMLAQYSKAERIERLMAQGISPADLEKAYNDGFSQGYQRAAVPTVEACYAAICLALHDVYGFGQTRCIRALNAVDERITTMITSEEVRREALDRAGVDIQFGEGVDRVGPKPRKKKGGVKK